MPAVLYVTPLDIEDVVLTVPDAVRRLAHRARVTAWAGDWSSGALVTCDPVVVARSDADPFAVFTRLPAVEPDPAYPEAVGGGWFGYLSFPARGGVPSFPRASLAWYRDVLRFDGAHWWYEALLDDGFGRTEAAARCADLCRDLVTPAHPEPARLEVTGVPDATAHVVAVERCVQAIRCGEIYQATIACTIEGRLHGCPHDGWARLVEAYAPARAALVADPAGTAVSASPELFLRRRGREVLTAPIKGTRPRTGGPADDHELDAAEHRRLAASEKDAAENVMIVDLMRNDLSRVCATGSIRVPRLLDVQAHPGVWHLVSTVQGVLAAGCDDADLLAAAFPPGSVTGAPKIRAVELVETLETTPRGLFTGAIGYVSPLAGLELAVAIRTLEVAPGGHARLGVGGGVTVDSTPVEEWAECLTKAAPVLRALGAAPLDPGPGLRGAALARRERGLFETLRVVDGRPLRVAEHVRRLRTSYAECYGTPLTADVAGAVADAVTGCPGVWRVRVDAAPGVPDRVWVTARPCPPPVPLDAQPGLVLRPHRLGPAGAPRHKFVDRAWIEAIEAPLAADEAALLVDHRDRLLEATRSSVFVVRSGVLATSPLDGRVLPGTARRAVLDALDGAGLPYDLVAPAVTELPGADGVFLVNAVRGVQWVRAAPGVTWAAPDRLTRYVARLLDPGTGRRSGRPSW